MSISNSHKLFQSQNSQPRVAVSACLLGQRVRYDGKQKQHAFVCRQLQNCCNLAPICPEVEIGMGVPRPAIQLIDLAGEIKAVGVAQSGLDVTQKLNRFGSKTAQQLSGLDGYVFKARSPSCGVASTLIKYSDGRRNKAAGLFAAQIMKQWPLLPVVEEDKLQTLAQQTNFVQRLMAYRRWRSFVDADPDWSDLRQFHQTHRFELMSHSLRGWRSLQAWLLARGDKTGCLSRTDLLDYGQQYMAQFGRQASRRRHEQVLRRLARLLHPGLSARQNDHLEASIERFRQAEQSLLVLISLLQKHQAHVGLSELKDQSYLEVDVEILRWAYKKQ